MIEIKETSQCTGCAVCVNSCVRNCISMKTDEEGFSYPHIDKEKCINCGLCKKKCPVKRQAVNKKEIGDTKAFALYALDENIVKESSSGGVFSLISKKVLGNEGVVFGAAFDDELNVHHIMACSEQELKKLKGSKYVQSNVSGCYKNVKEVLQQGRKVLFSGTPCQIAGLRSYLERDYENLICQDIVCHGVVSPDVWKKYLKHLEQKFGSKVCSVNFRDKRTGWQKYSFCAKLANGHEVLQSNQENVYMKAFLHGLSMRPACFECSFKGIQRCSDVTLADFWGANALCPDGYSEEGTSLVLVHTEKGRRLIEGLYGQAHITSVELPYALTFNQSAIKTAFLSPLRKEFFARYKKEDFDDLVMKLLPKETSKLSKYVNRWVERGTRFIKK